VEIFPLQDFDLRLLKYFPALRTGVCWSVMNRLDGGLGV